MTLQVKLSELVKASPNPLIQIHNSWERIDLSCVSDILNGFAFKSSEFSETKGFPLLRIRDINKRQTDCFYFGSYDPRYVVRRGDIVVGMDGDFNCARWDGPDALLNQRVCKISVKKDFYDDSFLVLVLPEYLNEINRHTSSVTVKHISSKTIADIPLPLPPLSEQRRIVAKVKALFVESKTVREALDKVPVLLRRFRQSVLAKAFKGELTQRDPNDEPAQKLLERIGQKRQRIWNLEKRGRYKQPLTPDVTSLPQLPSNWCWATIDQLSIVARGASPRPAGDPRFFGGKIPWITVGSLTADEQPYLETVRETVTEAGRDASRYIEPQTLLLTNSGATLGVPKITLIGGCINDGVVALLHVDYPLKSYLYYFLKSQTKRLRDIDQGAAQPNLNTDIIRAIQVPIPPLKEQDEIVARIDGSFSLSDRIEIDVKKTKDKTDSIDRVILAKAFRGELVPQDPNDEPASVFLERIKSTKFGSGRSACDPS